MPAPHNSAAATLPRCSTLGACMGSDLRVHGKVGTMGLVSQNVASASLGSNVLRWQSTSQNAVFNTGLVDGTDGLEP